MLQAAATHHYYYCTERSMIFLLLGMCVGFPYWLPFSPLSPPLFIWTSRLGIREICQVSRRVRRRLQRREKKEEILERISNAFAVPPPPSFFDPRRRQLAFQFAVSPCRRTRGTRRGRGILEVGVESRSPFLLLPFPRGETFSSRLIINDASERGGGGGAGISAPGRTLWSSHVTD